MKLKIFIKTYTIKGPTFMSLKTDKKLNRNCK